MTSVDVYEDLMHSVDIGTGPWSLGGHFSMNTDSSYFLLLLLLLLSMATLIWLVRLVWGQHWDNTLRKDGIGKEFTRKQNKNKTNKRLLDLHLFDTCNLVCLANTKGTVQWPLSTLPGTCQFIVCHTAVRGFWLVLIFERVTRFAWSLPRRICNRL